jgi:hypothetical protein
MSCNPARTELPAARQMIAKITARKLINAIPIHSARFAVADIALRTIAAKFPAHNTSKAISFHSNPVPSGLENKIV